MSHFVYYYTGDVMHWRCGDATGSDPIVDGAPSPEEIAGRVGATSMERIDGIFRVANRGGVLSGTIPGHCDSPQDKGVLMHVVEAFGHIVPVGEEVNGRRMAALIREHYDNDIARCYAATCERY